MRQEEPRGQTLIVSLVILFFLFALSVAVADTNTAVSRAGNRLAKARVANAAATAAIEKALWCLNHPGADADCGGASGTAFTGESSVVVGDATYTSTVTTIDPLTRDIDATASVPSLVAPVVSQRLRARATIRTDEVSFNYALQTGIGGLVLDNNAIVQGNVYANGNIQGSNGAQITGDVWVAGGTQPTPDQEWTVQDGDLAFGQDGTVVDPAQGFTPAAGGPLNSVRLYLKKVGSPANRTVRIVTDSGGNPSKTSLASATLDTSLVTGAYGWITVPFATPPTLATGTPYWILVDSATAAADYLVWGKDAADGYASGTGKTSPNWNAGSPVWTAVGADLAFQAWMGGVATFLDDVDVAGDLHANTIEDCTVGGDASYQTNTACTVSGTSTPNSPDPGPAAFPISDALIAQWKQDAATGGTIAGDYHVDGGSVSLGPKVIAGNLTFENNATLTITGTIYVQGTINFENNALIRLDPGFGSSSGVILADGWINASNNAVFQGAGIGSFILVLSTATGGGLNDAAIQLANNTTAAIFYAANGTIEVSNNVEVTGLTGRTVKLANNATLVYDIGLADARFTSGPGGEWAIAADSWREVK